MCRTRTSTPGTRGGQLTRARLPVTCLPRPAERRLRGDLREAEGLGNEVVRLHSLASGGNQDPAMMMIMSPNPHGQNWVWAVFSDIDVRKRSA